MSRIKNNGLSRDCKLSCCGSCSYCNRAVAKERRKTLSVKCTNKICERCFVCKSGRLQKFWQVWLSLGSNPRVVRVHTKGRLFPTLQSKTPPPPPPPLVKVTGHSHYADPVKSKNLKESLQVLIQKQAVEKVLVPSSLAFYNRLFLVPKSNNRWRPILDLSQLNLYLASASFKMETP